MYVCQYGCQIDRMILGVHKKSSRLGVLGELGRFPLFIKGLCHVLKYQAHLSNISNPTSLVGKAVKEMKTINDPEFKTWWGRTEQLKNLFGIKYSKYKNIEAVGTMIKKCVKSKFEIFWLKSINKPNDVENKNKLSFYAKLKGCFKKEPYIDFVPNRSQRCDLTRLRISSSHLAVEVMRYQRPYVPADERHCKYCRPMEDNLGDLVGHKDDEYHFVANCGTFTLKRNCLLGRYETIHPGIKELPIQSMVHTVLCPTSILKTKLINKFIKIMFETRKHLDDGNPILHQGYSSGIELNPFYDNDSDTDLDNSLDTS